VLVGSLKASIVLLADLSRAVGIPHALDTLEVERFSAAAAPAQADESTLPAARPGARILKDVDLDLRGRDVVLVEDVVDTGLTLAFLERHIASSAPRSVAALTLLDRPYRRLVPGLPLRWVGFTATDDLFVGYGFDFDERYRNLPDIHVLPGANARI
jgi:hypoxanthine phosphoribosyltransferase